MRRAYLMIAISSPFCLAWWTLCVLLSFTAGQAQTADPAAPQLVPCAKFTVTFPEMPPTLFDLWNKKTIEPAMTVFLPRNYDQQRKHPLLVFFNGWDGGDAANPGVARALSEEQDFVCVAMPLFKASLDPTAPGNTRAIIIQDADGEFAWPLYKTMLAKLEEIVPNIDPAHSILGGFSNGAHMTGALINQSAGEVVHYFSAFFLVDGGGGLKRFDLLEHKPLLMVCGVWRPKPEAPLAAGVKLTIYRMKEAKHAFPASEYPAVREWMRGPSMAPTIPEANGGAGE